MERLATSEELEKALGEAISNRLLVPDHTRRMPAALGLVCKT